MDLVSLFFLTFELVTWVVKCYGYEVSLHRQCCFSVEQSGHSYFRDVKTGLRLDKCRGIHALLPLTPSPLSMISWAIYLTAQ